MNIALLHNYYQHRGGEDTVFEAEARLLEERGHHIVRYVVHNDDIQHVSRLRLATATVYNGATYTALQTLFRKENIDLVHCHNTLPLISPSAYYAANDADIPVVQTLHNYRLLCPNALFFRNGDVCEDCLGKAFALPAVQHKCYRGSASASLAVAGMTALHRALGTWQRRVARYIALTEFAKAKFIEGGINADTIVVKPNFVEIDAGIGAGHGNATDGQYAVFLGRLSPEKGIMTALAAWKELGYIHGSVKLLVIGAGPSEEEARAYCSAHSLDTVRFLGQQPLQAALEILKEARFLLFPSLLYETFGKAMIEAFACGTPVIASRLGALAEVVEHGRTGFHVEAGNVWDIALKCSQMLGLTEESYAVMRQSARKEYEAKYTMQANMRLLEEIYREVLQG
jgi:glycosyltransferase involved in cell wall biosynthesis